MSGEKCQKWLNGSLRNYILFTALMLSTAGGGAGIYARLDDKIIRGDEKSYSREEGELIEGSLETMRTENRVDFRLMNNKLDVLLGIKPMSVLSAE